MGNISTTNESNPAVLESYFKKYPDVPKETILKQHLLSLGHWFSDAALRATAGALVKSYRLFSYWVEGQVLDLGISPAYYAATRDIECFAGRVRGIARCQKKRSF